MDFIDRLSNWMREQKVRQIDIVKKSGLGKSYISGVVNGNKQPSENLLNVLEQMSGHSCHWWLFGKEEYDNLDALNMLINTFIESNQINEDGKYDDKIKDILLTMLDKEIMTKIENKKRKG